MRAEETITKASESGTEQVTGNRRGALAALLAGSALGIAALGTAPSVASAKGKKGNKGKKSKGGGGSNAGSTLPSVRYAYKTTTFDSSGVVTASATCPNGYLPIGGGIWSSITNPVILSSLPELESNSWQFELDGAQPQHQATITAICLAASDDTTVEDTEHRSARRKKSQRGRKK